MGNEIVNCILFVMQNNTVFICIVAGHIHKVTIIMLIIPVITLQ